MNWKLNLKHARPYRRFLNRTEGILIKNPVLVCGVALPLAAVPTTSINSAVALIVAMLFAYVPVVLVASLVGERISFWLRVALYPALAAILLIPARMAVRFLLPTVFDSLGGYFSLICVAGMLFAGVEEAVKRKKFLSALRFSLFNWIGFSLVMLLMGLIRELIGSGTLAGMPVPFIKAPVPGVLMAFAGFILLGMGAAFCRFLHRVLTFVMLRTAEPLIHLEEDQEETEGAVR